MYDLSSNVLFTDYNSSNIQNIQVASPCVCALTSNINTSNSVEELTEALERS